MIHILIPIFVGIGIATVVIHIVRILIFLFSKIKKRMKFERKIRCLCKHIYKIDSIWNDEEMQLTCIKCGKTKAIELSPESLKEFRIGGRK